MRIFDDAWQKTSTQFWKHRRREFIFDLLLFICFHVLAGLFLYPLPALQFNVGYSIIGVYVNWVYIPWITFFWSIILLIHLSVLVAARSVERLFRVRVERQILRAYIEQNELSEKPKRHLWEPDQEFDIIEEPQEERLKIRR